eukprot:gene19344-25993_t
MSSEGPGKEASDSEEEDRARDTVTHDGRGRINCEPGRVCSMANQRGAGAGVRRRCHEDGDGTPWRAKRRWNAQRKRKQEMALLDQKPGNAQAGALRKQMRSSRRRS